MSKKPEINIESKEIVKTDLVLPKDFVEISIMSGDRSFSAKGERGAVRDSALQFLEKVLIPDLVTIEKYMKALEEFSLKTKKSHEEVLSLLKKMSDIVENCEKNKAREMKP